MQIKMQMQKSRFRGLHWQFDSFAHGPRLELEKEEVGETLLKFSFLGTERILQPLYRRIDTTVIDYRHLYHPCSAGFTNMQNSKVMRSEKLLPAFNRKSQGPGSVPLRRQCMK